MPTWNDPGRDEAAEALKARFARTRTGTGPPSAKAPRMTRGQWWIVIGVAILVIAASTLT
ncbi:MAG: hypothetical protein VX766_03070 [Pseudomonadota bacterium]|nr:hypothetical protein [Pseudomonadota bacterium]